jgi:hypothetical protein
MSVPGGKAAVLRVDTVETVPTAQARNEGFFRTRTGNLVRVDTVKTTPTIDNPRTDQLPGALRFKRLKRLEQAWQSTVPASLAMWVLECHGRQTTLSQAISSRSLNARSKER